MSAVSTATLHARADEAAAAGDFPTALSLSADVLAAVPDDHRARLKVGLCLAMLGRTSDAIATLNVVAESLAHRGFMLAAIGACRDALGLDPDDPTVVATLRRIHGRMHGIEGRGRGRVPPPIPPSTVDPDQGFAAQPEAERVAAAVALALTSPVTGEPAEAEHVPLFSELGEDAFVALVPEIRYLKVGEGHPVIRQGNTGTSVYVLLEGEVLVSRDDGDGGAGELARLGGGALFGEMALLTDKARVATVVTTKPSELFEIDKATLEGVAQQHPQLAQDIVKFARRRLLANVMATSPLFRPFDHDQRFGILKQFESLVVDAGATLITDGHPPEGLFVIVEGEVEVSKVDPAGDRVVLAYLRAGDVFGEIGVMENRSATADVRATERTVVLCLDRERFKAFASEHPAIVTVLEELSGTRRAELEEAMADGIALDADDLIIL